jgi:acetyl-CoA acetyltransferase
VGDDVYIIGAAMTPFAKHPDKSIKQLTAEAMEALRRDVAVDVKDIQAAWFSNTGWGMYQGQHSIRGEVALTPIGIQGIPVTNVENACAGGSTALREAWMSIKAGLYDVVLAVGAEKVWMPEDKKKMFEGFMAGADVEFIRPIIERFQADAKKKASEAKPSGGEKRGGTPPSWTSTRWGPGYTWSATAPPSGSSPASPRRITITAR